MTPPDGTADYGIAPARFRLPPDTHVGRVRLQVSDLERSHAFYSRVLGLEDIESGPGSVVLGAAGLPLVELRPGAHGPLRTPRLGLYHFAMLLPDRPALGRFLKHLLELGIEPGASDHLVSEALYLSDPDGLGIEVYRDRPREEWQVRDKQLAMATDPLDFDGILAAANDETWSGVAAGTVMGHIHLHVGEITAARDFYHHGLGLDLMVWSYPGALFLAAGGYHHHVGLNTWAGPRAQSRRADEPGLMDWELVLPNAQSVASVAQSLISQGFAATREEIGGSIVSDPWGTNVRLVAN